jgi:hypothetical protein
MVLATEALLSIILMLKVPAVAVLLFQPKVENTQKCNSSQKGELHFLFFEKYLNKRKESISLQSLFKNS